jgi:hypothetical protein
VLIYQTDGILFVANCIHLFYLYRVHQEEHHLSCACDCNAIVPSEKDQMQIYADSNADTNNSTSESVLGSKYQTPRTHRSRSRMLPSVTLSTQPILKLHKPKRQYQGAATNNCRMLVPGTHTRAAPSA